MSIKTKRMVSQTVLVICLSIVVVISFFPYYFMIISSFKNNAEISANPFILSLPLRIENYIDSFGMIVKYYKNSLIISGTHLLLTTFTTVCSAYIFARFQFPGKNTLYILLLMFRMIPGVLTLIPQYVLVSDMGIIGTYWAAILPSVAGAQIGFIVVLRPYIEGLPQDLFEAAKLDGASGIQTFRYVAAPLIKPTLTSQMLLTFMGSWNDFVWPMLTLSANKELKTVTLGLYSFSDVQQVLYGPMFAGFVIASVPMLIVFVLNMKTFISGLTAGAVKL